MLVAFAAMAFVAAIIVINGDDDDDETVIPDEELVDENGLTPWGDASEAPSEGNDVLIGSSGNDAIFAEEGSDTVAGEDGNDRLFGNQGNDYLIGGDGDDFERGGLGTDILVGGSGDDHLIGDADSDFLKGDDGDDTLIGGSGGDVLIGNDGADSLVGGTGDDELYGGAAKTEAFTDEDFTQFLHDLETGAPTSLWGTWYLSREDDGAADTLDGGAGIDYLFVNDGDTAIGGEDPDRFYLLDGDGDETALIADFDVTEDVLIYIYDEGMDAPTLTLVDNDDGTQTLLADGAAVSVIVSSGLALDDIYLSPRTPPPS